MTASSRSAVVLAGGYSTRFGDEDKAVASLSGVPMIRRVADRLAAVTDRLVVNCRRDQRSSLANALDGYPSPVAFAFDPAPDRGPMAGIRTGLRAVEAESEYAFVVACDMPFVDPGLVAHLFDRAEGHDAAVPRIGDGWFQTTHAVYRASPMADACDDALERGESKIVAPLFDLDYVVVEEREVREFASLEAFENVNTREELREAENRLSS
ncbi:molybdenum cofactor guanylyltransferase [Halegenticoccus tardaugens]|uniref:molybdenum cofactor guanylyltransferase n=1 Tax=Halegenticoccus tardaugens TaxID=2071624 RepID=UPI001E3D771E|nr:molybdenum cofactor guanylyltransferase [Halegenticoccus tardaugens]